MRPLSRQWLLFSILSCAFLFGAGQTVSACTCAARPTVLDSFDESDEVVIARVISVEKVEETDEQHHYVNGVRSTTMVVDRVFKGQA